MGNIYHEWNGTVLTITSDSGTSSADLKGDTGIRGPQGPIGDITTVEGPQGPQGEPGPMGEQGERGYTPVRGVDYWTDEDINEFAAYSVSFLNEELAKRTQIKPEFANNISECVDTSKIYMLPDGYLYIYQLSTVYPEITIESETGGFWEYKNGSMQWATASGYSSKKTNILSVTPGDKLEYTGMAMWNVVSVVWYDSEGNILTTEQHNQNESTHTTVTVTAPANAKNVQFYSFRSTSNIDNVILEVKWIECAGATSVQWTNSGIPFVAGGGGTTPTPVEAVSPLKGKKIVYDGDSICAGVHGGGGYAKIIADKTEGTAVNQAVGGARLVTSTETSTYHSIVDNLVNLPTDGDLYCFDGGVNDVWSLVSLGTYSMSDYKGEVDKTTICGALETIFRYCLEHFVGKPICFVITHKVSNISYENYKNYHDSAVAICQKYSIPFYDAYNESGLNGWNTTQSNAYLTGNASNVADGCHPNEAGYKKYYVPQLISLFEKIMPVE